MHVSILFQALVRIFAYIILLILHYNSERGEYSVIFGDIKKIRLPSYTANKSVLYQSAISV